MKQNGAVTAYQITKYPQPHPTPLHHTAQAGKRRVAQWHGGGSLKKVRKSRRKIIHRAKGRKAYRVMAASCHMASSQAAVTGDPQTGPQVAKKGQKSIRRTTQFPSIVSEGEMEN